MVIVDTSEAITLVGGADPRRTDITTALSHAPNLVAADGGAAALLAAGLRPMVVIGDMDSIGADAKAAFSDRLVEVSNQDTTDLEKCLYRIAAPLIIAVGFSGGRLDHTLAVLNVLARFPDRRIVLLGRDDATFLAPGRLSLHLAPGTRLSLLPLAAARLTTQGLRWDLRDADFAPDGAISISNAVAAPVVQISAIGPLLVILPPAALPAVVAALTDAARGQ